MHAILWLSIQLTYTAERLPGQGESERWEERMLLM
jgi:hypothetical protein